MDIKTKVVVDLALPFDYAKGGQMVPATSITIMAPSRKNLAHTAPIQQTFKRALRSLMATKVEQAKPGEAPKDAGEIKGEDVLDLIMMSDEDYLKFEMHFRDLLTSQGVAFVDGTEPLTTVLYDRLSEIDATKIVGEYLTNFLLFSATRK